ncbi:hypothetical protein GUJ93_ZPchr0013g35132 [Zizania palustris]|uniref:Uncharacterized protein n=1 Tax=Zizania palustris TaxID=103762 RepID=A0A8J5WRT7_ZIZPA|nr:hypothetical protein GUJ93_ZPchr0013g35132 [Zizania palustris]
MNWKQPTRKANAEEGGVGRRPADWRPTRELPDLAKRRPAPACPAERRAEPPAGPPDLAAEQTTDVGKSWAKRPVQSRRARSPVCLGLSRGQGHSRRSPRRGWADRPRPVAAGVQTGRRRAVSRRAMRRWVALAPAFSCSGKNNRADNVL